MSFENSTRPLNIFVYLLHDNEIDNIMFIIEAKLFNNQPDKNYNNSLNQWKIEDKRFEIKRKNSFM